MANEIFLTLNLTIVRRIKGLVMIVKNALKRVRLIMKNLK